jgi:oxygen-independent coproporphyrinogen-3 oxidase
VHIYVHVPFCARRCSYCDFAIAVRRQVPSADFARAIIGEWESWQAHPAWADAPVVQTVYFGGGTPSRVDPSAIAAILARIASDRPIAAGAEITLEANPDDVDAERAAAWRQGGVNRVSLGVQSFEPAVLEWMHRTHRTEQVAPAVAELRRAGISELSLDLIFALPEALGRDWPADLEAALALRPEHLSLYGLTVEPATPLGRWAARGEVTAPPDERWAGDFLHADRRLRDAGYEHYEVSNAALPGHRARHNSAYWTRAPFIGLGPSAHSGFGRERRWNIRDWAAYQRAAAAGLTLAEGSERLDGPAVRLEQIYLGLRTDGGLPVSDLADHVRAGWERAGWAETADGRVRLTPEGWLRLDALVAAAA